MEKRIISLDQTAKMTQLSKNTILRYVRAGDFPAAIPNPRNLYLFWDHDVEHWTQHQKKRVMQKWHEAHYKNKSRTMNYISQLQQQLIVDTLVRGHLTSVDIKQNLSAS